MPPAKNSTSRSSTFREPAALKWLSKRIHDQLHARYGIDTRDLRADRAPCGRHSPPASAIAVNAPDEHDVPAGAGSRPSVAGASLHGQANWSASQEPCCEGGGASPRN